MSLLNAYDGPFDPGFELSKLSRTALARLGREYMLFQHIRDRAGVGILGRRFGPAGMTQVAVDLWIGASPVYNRRMRKLLKITGDGVTATFKGLQTDVGFPHQFQAVKYHVENEKRGTFWLTFCGVYEHVAAGSRFNPKAIKNLCHDMEDTTFLATVRAVNPKADCLPDVRPPLAPGYTGPTCRWVVTIDESREAVPPSEVCRLVSRSKAAQFEYALPADPGTDGINDYSGPFLPDLALEDFSQPTLAVVCKEFTMADHLLNRSAHLCVRQLWGEEVMREIAAVEWAVAAQIYTVRLRRALDIRGTDMSAILKTLQVDPAFPPDYVKRGYRLVDDKHGYFWIEDCPLLADDPDRGWLTLLPTVAAPGFDGTVAAVNPRARCRPIAPAQVQSAKDTVVYAWEIVIDETAEPRPVPAVKPMLADELLNFPMTFREEN
ncbi:MAG: hypothetical protein H6Q33_5264 [Deltaproteobacteria bacterium]|nr:hypothetical protein [Deltaproteobacteria bacterium]